MATDVRYIAVMPWWAHTPSEEEVQGIKSIKNYCDIPLALVLPRTCALPRGLVADRVERFDDQWFSSQWSYSRLLLSSHFYERFASFEYLVIVQSDVLLLRKMDHKSLSPFDMDYTGAPWVKTLADGAYQLHHAGNGGFSLRKVQSFLKILHHIPPFLAPELGNIGGLRGMCLMGAFAACSVLRRRTEVMARALVSLKVHEDTFWSRVAPAISSSFRVCPPEVSARFAVECEPAFVMTFAGELGPLGAHGWKKHGKHFFDSRAYSNVAAKEPSADGLNDEKSA